MKVLYTETDDYDDLSIRPDGYLLKAKCFECQWSARCSTIEVQEVEKAFTAALGHTHDTGHAVTIDRSESWDVYRVDRL